MNPIQKFLFLALSAIACLVPQMSWADDPQPSKAAIHSVMEPYLKIHDALAKDSLDGVAQNAAAIANAVKGDSTLPGVLAVQCEVLSMAKDLDGARAAFIPLSNTLISMVKSAHNTEYVQAYCPMVKQNWLQVGTDISNPFGAEMSSCGEVVSQ